MGKYRLFLVSVLITTAVIAVLSSCNQNIKMETKELRWGYSTEPATLDPLNPANTADGRSILFNVFEGLVKPDIDGTFLPCIAESWTVDQNARVYNFLLREGVRFHDGALLTAQDVKFSLDTAVAKGFIGLGNIEEVRISAENEISVILKSADPDFLPYLTTGIVKEGNADREKNITGTGPFLVESYTPQRNLILRKFDNYWQSNPAHLEKITIAFFANSDSLMVALRGGGIDGAFITGSMAAQLDHREFDFFFNNSAAVQLLALNNNSPPLNDINIRRALVHCIDVPGIIDTAFFGQGQHSASPLIPGLSIYYENTIIYPYNPNLARALLSQAGFNETNRLSLEITAPSNFTMHVDTAQVIVSQLENIGVNASIKLVDWPTWISQVYIGRQHQATIISLDSPTVSPRGFLHRYYSSDGGNFINFNNADYDRVYDAVLTEADTARRVGLYREAQRIITEDAASVFIQDIFYFIVLRSGVFSGALDYPLYVIDFSSLYKVSKH